jgi:hypothetical protein
MTLARPSSGTPAPKRTLERPELAAAVGIALSVTLGGFAWAALLFFLLSAGL